MLNYLSSLWHPLDYLLQSIRFPNVFLYITFVSSMENSNHHHLKQHFDLLLIAPLQLNPTEDNFLKYLDVFINFTYQLRSDHSIFIYTTVNVDIVAGCYFLIVLWSAFDAFKYPSDYPQL